MASESAPDHSAIPFAYRLFFLYVEPLAALAGSFYAGAFPAQYLAYLTPVPPADPPTPPTGTLVTLYQLSNLFLFCSLNQALVLRSTASRRTWRALLFSLLVADVGHLATLVPLAAEKGWLEVFLAGDAFFVYAAAGMRVAFLLGLGLRGAKAKAREGQGEGERLVGGDVDD